MVYKKYIKRGDKVFGPYLYESKKQNGRVTTEYHGKAQQKKNNPIFLIGFVILFLLSFIFLVYPTNSPVKSTGYAIFHHNNSADWTGIFNNTLIQGNNITLNFTNQPTNTTYAPSGNYSSQIITIGANAAWNNLSWTKTTPNGTNTYDFSNTNNKQAFEKNGSIPSNPFDYRNVATSGNYTNIGLSDDNRWVTSGASNGQYDSQIYLFNITESGLDINLINITWEGYGETATGYYTNLSIFNWTSNSWYELTNKDFTSASDSILNGLLTSGFSNFVNSTTNQIAILATTRKALSLGEACTLGTQCSSGLCADGYCCDSACDSACQACNVSGSHGTCTGVTQNEGKSCTGVCTSCISGTCTGRAADDTTEGCTATCYDCVGGSCSAVTQDTDGTCTAACNSCVSGTCTNRTIDSQSAGCTGCNYCNGYGICRTMKVSLIDGTDIHHCLPNGTPAWKCKPSKVGNIDWATWSAPDCDDNFLPTTLVDEEDFPDNWVCMQRICEYQSSPFIYYYTGSEYQYLYDFFPGATSKNLEYASFTDITNKILTPNLTIKLKVTEQLSETAYLDSYKLQVYDYPSTKKDTFERWLNSSFEVVSFTCGGIQNLKRINNVTPDFIDTYDIYEPNQSNLTSCSDNKYLILEKGFEKELEFNAPELKKDYSRKIFFVAEGYYIENDITQKEKTNNLNKPLQINKNSFQLKDLDFFNLKNLFINQKTPQTNNVKTEDKPHRSLYTDYIKIEITSETKIKFQIRSCNDPDCSGETFVGIDNTSTSYFTNSTLTILNTTLTPDNRYFQYKAFLLTSNTSITPHLSSVAVDYLNLDITAPIITTISPQNNSKYNITIVEFNVSLNENASWCGYSLDYASNVTMTKFNNTYFNYTKTDLSDGIHNVTVSCNDTSNNYGAGNLTFFLIDTTRPSINITFPLNNTNTSNNQLTINYTVSDINLQACWYSLNGETNTTITCGENISGLTSIEGNNIWRIYANDSVNNLNSSSVTFFKDSIKPTINFTDSTTTADTYQNFTWIYVNVTANDTNLQSIKIYLYNSTFSLINSTNSSASSLEINFTGLSDGVYYINATANDSAGNINQTETRKIYIDTSAPTVLLISPEDGASMTETTTTFSYRVFDNSPVNCSLILNGTIINFNSSVDTLGATNTFANSTPVGNYTWSINCTDYFNLQANSSTKNFSIVTPAEPPPGGGQAGRGGGARNITAYAENFTIDKDLIYLSMKQGETKNETLTIKNIGPLTLNIKINSSQISKFAIISEESFTLSPNESKTVHLDFFAREQEIPDAYTGRIIVQGNTTNKTINVILEVKERKPVFDLRVDVSNKKVISGNNIDFNLLAINQGDLKGFDILLQYSIKDFEGKIYETKEESIKIDNALDLQRSLQVPSDLPFGKYILYSKISYNNITASGIDTFDVVSENVFLAYNLIMFSIVFLIFVISSIIIIIWWFKLRKNKELILINNNLINHNLP